MLHLIVWDLGLRRIKDGFLNDGFGDLLRELVEMAKILIPAIVVGVGSRGCAYTSIARGMTAFIHITQHTHSLCFLFSEVVGFLLSQRRILLFPRGFKHPNLFSLPSLTKEKKIPEI